MNVGTPDRSNDGGFINFNFTDYLFIDYCIEENSNNNEHQTNSMLFLIYINCKCFNVDL